jgi:hypothetical protein
MVSERGQAHTLESLIAALLLLVSIGIALQMTAVTPLSASTSSQHLENQLEKTTQGILASNAETGSLKDAVLYWDTTSDSFHGTTGGREYYTEGPPEKLKFGRTLNKTLNQRNVAYNVYVYYTASDGDRERQRMIYEGEPSEHAVTASQTVTITRDDRLRDKDGNLTSKRVNSTNLYIRDSQSSNTGLYNQVRVEVVAWRI